MVKAAEAFVVEQQQPPDNLAAVPSDPNATLFVPYVVALSVLGAFCTLLLVTDHKCKVACKPLSCEPPGWDVRYLLPYAMCAAGDWLQGPYVYALYDSYGYDR